MQGDLLAVIQIDVRIAERVDELAGNEPGHLRDHHREQRIGCDVERNAQKDVGAALV